MKKQSLVYAAIAAAAVSLVGLSSCDALWGTSVDYSPTPGASISIGTTVPTGAWYNPYYWDGGWSPALNYYPGPIRPGWGNSGWGIVNNRPTGTVRPPTRPGINTTPSVPSTPNINNSGNLGTSRPGSTSSSVVPPAGTFPNIGSAEPGVVMPPSGSGMRPGRH